MSEPLPDWVVLQLWRTWSQWFKLWPPSPDRVAVLNFRYFLEEMSALRPSIPGETALLGEYRRQEAEQP